jgi:hypothetical protein
MAMRILSRQLKHHLFKRGQTGQAIILLALAMIGLLAFVGLVTDISLLFVRFSQLRRAVDAASIAAAGQIRENREYADVALAARQFIRLHGLDPDRVLVETCVTNPGDPELCTVPPRKLVRVQAQIDSPTTFLRLIGWQTVTLETSAVSETAALDVALVLDTSESMAAPTSLSEYTAVEPSYTARTECVDNYNYYECCNDPGNGQISINGIITNLSSNVVDNDFSDLVCQPFKQVKDAAREFVQRLDFVRGDRVVFVTFDRGSGPVIPDNPSGPGTLPPLITDEGVAIDTLNKKIGVGVNHPNNTGEFGRCITFGREIPWTYEFIAPCPDTNMGGGIASATQALTDPLYIRRTAVWVIILLSDGAANATPPATDSDGIQVPDVSGTYGRWGYCPWYTFCDPSLPDKDAECTEVDPSDSGARSNPFCTDNDPTTRHFCMTATGRVAIDAPGCDVTRYDANDFTMDMADFAGLVEVREGVVGNFIAMYTIGFGTPAEPIPALGEATLRYIADAGDNGLIDNDLQQDCRENGLCGDHNPSDLAFFGPAGPCQNAAYKEDCGQYWYADNPDDLERVFSEIASRLFTRLSR